MFVVESMRSEWSDVVVWMVDKYYEVFMKEVIVFGLISVC